MIKAIIFDMDGTLYPLAKDDDFMTSKMYKEVKTRCYGFIMKHFKVDEKEAIKIWERVAKKYDGHVSVGLEKDHGVDRFAYFDYTWDIDPKNHVPTHHVPREILEKIKIKKILLSNAPKKWVDRVLKHLNIADVFDDIYTGESDVRKPLAQAYLQCLKKYNIQYDEAIMVGDMEKDDLHTAKRLGMTTVSIPLKLPSAKYFIKTINELPRLLKKMEKVSLDDDRKKLDIIIDTDPGHDDAMAIMLAIKSGMFRIHAITTVAGNSRIDNTTRNARYVLNLLEREDISIYSGAEKPLRRKLITADVHGASGLEGIDPKNPAMLDGKAVDKILSIIKDNPNRITIVSIGPMTNIAQAIIKDPKIMLKAKQIVSMGGAIRVAGNKNRVAEFNIFVDPEAADIVFKFPIKKTLVPLDACNHVRLYLRDFMKIKNVALKNPLMSMAKPYINNTLRWEGISAAFMYDPLTIYSLMNPRACKYSRYNVVIETMGEHTSGMTVAELRMKNDEKPNVTVIESVSEKDFKKDFINYLSR